MALLFCGIFAALAFSFSGLILTSNMQVGALNVTTETLEDDGDGNMVMAEGEPMFPRPEGGLALQGKQVYIEMGCIYCHTQQLRRADYGADIDRGWGPRATVPRDYILQDRVLLGTMRTGPDLANIGGRPLNADWHHLHLYNPQTVSEGSNMPPFPFLYEVKEIADTPSQNALSFKAGSKYAPEPGYEIVPTRDAEALVAYLLSLKIDYSLPEAPILD
ncbi:MAG: cbb3-type cytochrome c oxidase subunit II [Verrucomicrobiota bacterium]